jgi:hypothetical protein
VRWVRHARYILGPEGSGTYLAFLADPGARMCVLSPPCTLGLVDIGAILAAVGVDFTVVTGPEVANDEFSPFWYHYTIEPRGFAEFLDHWLSDDAPA